MHNLPRQHRVHLAGLNGRTGPLTPPAEIVESGVLMVFYVQIVEVGFCVSHRLKCAVIF